MKKHVFGRKFKRDKNQRKALFKGLVSSFILYGKMETTEAKAKAVKGKIDSLVAKVKKNNQDIAKRLIAPYVAHNAIEKFVNEVAPALTDRAGAYTTIAKLGRRTKDDAPMVLLSWVENIQPKKQPAKKKTSKANEMVIDAEEIKEEKKTVRKPRAKKAEAKK